MIRDPVPRRTVVKGTGTRRLSRLVVRAIEYERHNSNDLVKSFSGCGKRAMKSLIRDHITAHCPLIICQIRDGSRIAIKRRPLATAAVGEAIPQRRT